MMTAQTFGWLTLAALVVGSLILETINEHIERTRP